MTTRDTNPRDHVWVSDSCTLPTSERPLRIAEFDELFARSLRSVERIDSTTTRLILNADAVDRAQGLAERESSCCSFFTFEFSRVDAGQTAMLVTVPGARAGVLDALTVRAAATAGLDG